MQISSNQILNSPQLPQILKSLGSINQILPQTNYIQKRNKKNSKLKSVQQSLNNFEGKKQQINNSVKAGLQYIANLNKSTDQLIRDSIQVPSYNITPDQFRKEVDLVIQDDRLIKGYRQAKKGDESVKKERLQIYKQDFEVKINQMNIYLNKEVVNLSKSFDIQQQNLKSKNEKDDVEMKPQQKRFKPKNSIQKNTRISDIGIFQDNLMQNQNESRKSQKQQNIKQISKISQDLQITKNEIILDNNTNTNNDSDTASEDKEIEDISNKNKDNINKEPLNSFKILVKPSKQNSRAMNYQRENTHQTTITSKTDNQYNLENKSQLAENDKDTDFIKKLEDLVKNFNLDFSTLNRVASGMSISRSNSPTFDLVMNLSSSTREKAAQIITTDIKEKNFFYDLCKNYTAPSFIDKYQNDAKFKFFEECNKQQVVSLPALSKIQNKTLILSGYQLNQGVCKAINIGLKLNKNYVQKVILDSNGMNDQMLSDILIGIEAQEDFKCLIITRNTLDKQSHSILTKLLERKFPYNLEELRLNNCKVSQGTTVQILQSIRENMNLRKLALIKASFNDQALSLLEEIIKNSRQLVELDLSWNDIFPNQVKSILVALSQNRTLQYLNLSWNNLQNGHAVNDEEQSNFIIENLGKFIKYNKNLLHIDLSQTRLSQPTIRELGTCLRRARSLLAIHFSGNPGVCPELKYYLQERIKCLKTQSGHIVNNQWLQKTMNQNSPRQDQLSEGVHMRQIQSKKRIQTIQQQNATTTNLNLGLNDKLIFQRWLGHKQDMPGSGQWQMLEESGDSCWICEKYVYTMIFWNKQIGFNESSDISMKDLETLKTQIQEKNQQINHEENQPYISGIFNNWIQKKLIPVQDLCQKIDTQYQEPFSILKKLGKFKEDIENENQIVNQKEIDMVQQLKLKIISNYKSQWKEYITKNIRYKKALFLNANQQQDIENNNKIDKNNYANSHHNDLMNQNLYVLSCFMKPGKQIYSAMVSNSFNEQSEQEWFVHKCIAPVREEEIPIYVNASKQKQVQSRIFKKETSVFKDWKEDTEQSLSVMLDDDFKFWKVHRFIKDEYDRQRCENIIKDNIQLIKKIFISEICKSAYPNISWIDYSNFCEKCKIFDKNIGLATIDRIFIATNVELEEKMDDNPEKMLCRYEFYEILVRVAQTKFKDPGICSTYSEALTKLLNEHIFLYSNPDDWQEFRDQDLWTMEINDTLEANLEGLKQVYSFYFEPRKKFMTVQDALSLMMRDTQLGFNEKDSLYCYGMCKMTVVFESENAIQYKQLKFVELLELLGRITIMKFKGTELETALFVRKLEFILDIVLKMVDLKRKEVNIVIDEESESDDEY